VRGYGGPRVAVRRAARRVTGCVARSGRREGDRFYGDTCIIPPLSSAGWNTVWQRCHPVPINASGDRRRGTPVAPARASAFDCSGAVTA